MRLRSRCSATSRACARHTRRLERFINSLVLEHELQSDWARRAPKALTRTLILDERAAREEMSASR